MIAFLGGFIDNLLNQTPDLSIPLWQLLMYLVLASIAALYERHRLILVLSFAALVYWVFVHNKDLLEVSATWFIAGSVFVLLGLPATLLAIYQMLTKSD